MRFKPLPAPVLPLLCGLLNAVHALNTFRRAIIAGLINCILLARVRLVQLAIAHQPLNQRQVLGVDGLACCDTAAKAHCRPWGTWSRVLVHTYSAGAHLHL